MFILKSTLLHGFIFASLIALPLLAEDDRGRDMADLYAFGKISLDGGREASGLVDPFKTPGGLGVSPEMHGGEEAFGGSGSGTTLGFSPGWVEEAANGGGGGQIEN